MTNEEKKYTKAWGKKLLAAGRCLVGLVEAEEDLLDCIRLAFRGEVKSAKFKLSRLHYEVGGNYN